MLKCHVSIYEAREHIFRSSAATQIRHSLGKASGAIPQVADADIARLTQPASERPRTPMLMVQL